MGSGIFLGAVVVAWFVVLVPMVLTRRDSAVEMALAEDDSSSARVLHRASKLRTRTNQGRSGMNASETSPSRDRLQTDQEAYDADYPYYDDPAYDDTVDTAVHERITAAVVDDEVDADESAPRSMQVDVMARRRRTLMMLGGLVVVTLALAPFVGSWMWLVQGAADLALIGYIAHLRGEARRTEERRLTRDVRSRRARPASAVRAEQGRSQSSLAANAFVATSITAPEPVLLDDEDPAFYDLADAPVAGRADLTGHEYYSEYQDLDYDYDSEDYGIHGAEEPAEPGSGYDFPRAV